MGRASRLELPLRDLDIADRTTELLLRLELEEGDEPYTVADTMLDVISRYLRREQMPLPEGGSHFQRMVWAAVQQIPFGEART